NNRINFSFQQELPGFYIIHAFRVEWIFQHYLEVAKCYQQQTCCCHECIITPYRQNLIQPVKCQWGLYEWEEENEDRHIYPKAGNRAVADKADEISRRLCSVCHMANDPFDGAAADLFAVLHN